MYSRPDHIFTHGNGCYLYDERNTEFLDFTAGIAVAGLGHADKSLAKILYEQAKKLITTSNLFHNEHHGLLAELLVKSTKTTLGNNTWGSKVFFTNSGTEANEAALKFCRKYAYNLSNNVNKYKFICFKNAFHGRTFGSLSATPKKQYQKPFEPLVPGFTVFELNNTSQFNKIDLKDYCGIIIEPIQGEGGINECNLEFIKKLKQVSIENDLVLIYDEIQCGLSRTGKLWAHQHYLNETHNVDPDIMCVAKPLANGMPIGAVIVNDRVANSLKVGDHGTTFGGNPICVRAGIEIFSRLNDESFITKVREKGEYLKNLIKNELKQYNIVEEVRGKGLIVGIKFINSINPTDICNLARKKGLLIIIAGDNCIRLVPPLIVTKQELKKGVGIIKECIVELYLNKPN